MSAKLLRHTWWSACLGLALGLLPGGQSLAQQSCGPCQGPHCTLPCCNSSYLFWQHHLKPHGRNPTGPFCGTECSAPPQGPHFGYFPTCWHRFPESWENCPTTPWESGVRSPGPCTTMYSPGGTPLHSGAGAVEEYAPQPAAPQVAPQQPAPPAPVDKAPPAPESDGDAYHRPAVRHQASRPQPVPASPVSVSTPTPVMVPMATPETAVAVQRAPEMYVAPEVQAAPQVPTAPEAPSIIELRPAPRQVASVRANRPLETASVPKPTLEVRRIPAVETEPARNVPVVSEEIAPLPTAAVEEQVKDVVPQAPAPPQVVVGRTHLANLLNPLRADQQNNPQQRVSGSNRNNPLR